MLHCRRPSAPGSGADGTARRVRRRPRRRAGGQDPRRGWATHRSSHGRPERAPRPTPIREVGGRGEEPGGGRGGRGDPLVGRRRRRASGRTAHDPPAPHHDGEDTLPRGGVRRGVAGRRRPGRPRGRGARPVNAMAVQLGRRPHPGPSIPPRVTAAGHDLDDVDARLARSRTAARNWSAPAASPPPGASSGRTGSGWAGPRPRSWAVASTAASRRGRAPPRRTRALRRARQRPVATCGLGSCRASPAPRSPPAASSPARRAHARPARPARPR